MTGSRILVIDDDDDVREITQLALEVMGGCDVLVAAGGAAGLELARAHRPDVVLLDVMMPGMDGPTTFGHLQRDPATWDIPVILLTAKVQVGRRQVWDGLAIAGVISKPFNPTTLTAEIDVLVQAHARHAAKTPVPHLHSA